MNILIVLLVRLVLFHDLLLLLLKTTDVGTVTTFSLVEGSLLIEAGIGASLEAKLSSLHVHNFDLLAHFRGAEVLHIACLIDGSVIVISIVVIKCGTPLGPVGHAERPLVGLMVIVEEFSLGKAINLLSVFLALLVESLAQSALELGRGLVGRRCDNIESDSGGHVELAAYRGLLTR